MKSEEIDMKKVDVSSSFSFKDTFFASASSVGLVMVFVAISSLFGESDFASIGGEVVHGVKGFFVTLLFALLLTMTFTLVVWLGSKIHHLIRRIVSA